MKIGTTASPRRSQSRAQPVRLRWTAVLCSVPRSSMGTHEVDNLYGACRYGREETAGAIGQEYWPQSFLSRCRGDGEYLEIKEWQVVGIKRATASLDRGEGIPHDQVKDWVASWESANEKPAPKDSSTRLWSPEAIALAAAGYIAQDDPAAGQ